MKRYQHTRDEAYSNETMPTIAKYEDDGWELVAVVPWNSGTNGVTLYFKRPVETQHKGTSPSGGGTE